MKSLSQRYNKRHGIGGPVLGIVVLVLIVVASAAGYYAASAGTSTTTSVSTSTVTTTSTTTVTGTGGPTTTTSTSTTSTSTTSTSSIEPPATINAGGSSLVFPLMSEWTFAYTQVQPNIQVNYQSIGSGTGSRSSQPAR